MRRSIAFVILCAALLVIPAGADATTVNYWGFNNLSGSNPPAGSCSFFTFPSGYVCSGWNYWDRSQVQNNSGGQINLGFVDNQGSYFSVSRSGIATYTVYRTDFQFVPLYNRVMCSHGPGTNYVQCRAIIIN